ncbi:HAD hydrolase-like protein [Polynucleobacter paneuropaeus]|uniref:HAD family hydrolase n=1 Tax=Polynucleobacter paneuropaeus TaxID=2527775 RepID=UPI001BFD6C97|nr:HAD hydrolase-like protein [Polynucleobacter paneuropaeus]QWD49710.1 HAD hydrolase-like protein [Polynucleobacter paneuropaeus]
MKSSKISTVIFDLDGTLIDSGRSILMGLEAAVMAAGCTLMLPLGNDLIGPPLRLTLQNLSGEANKSKLEEMVVSFMRYYDSSGYKNSEPYEGADQLLLSLKENGCRLILATNKRSHPTLKILEYLGWTSFFDSIYTIDKYPNKTFFDKEEMLMALIKVERIESDSAIYVGDRFEDQLAANKNGLLSITVDWGYGEYEDISVYSVVASSMEQLMHMLISAK